MKNVLINFTIIISILQFANISFSQVNNLENAKIADVRVQINIRSEEILAKAIKYNPNLDFFSLGKSNVTLSYQDFTYLIDRLIITEYKVLDPITDLPFEIRKLDINDEMLGSWHAVATIQGNSEEFYQGNWDEGATSSSYPGPGTISFGSWGALGLDIWNTWGDGMWITYNMSPNAPNNKILFRCQSNESGTGQYAKIYIRNFITWEWYYVGIVEDKTLNTWEITFPSYPYINSDGRCDFIAGSNDGYVFDYIQFQQFESALNITSLTPTTTQVKDWGQSVTYNITVTDDEGNPVSNASVSGTDNLMSQSFSVTTNSSGIASYTTTVPNGKANNTYSISFTASKSGYTSSSTLTRNVQVNHSYQLVITSLTPTATQIEDWGESVTYTITVKDGAGNPVSNALVGGTDNLMSQSFSVTTNSSGIASYTTTVPNGKANNTYGISFTASKSGYTSSSTLTRYVQVNHSYQLVITSLTPTATQVKDWGESVTYTITVKDDAGNPVSNASVGGTDNLMSQSFSVTTNSSGIASYTTTVPNGKANNTYGISFTASKSGYTSSSTLTRYVQVNHIPPTILTLEWTDASGTPISSVIDGTIVYLRITTINYPNGTTFTTEIWENDPPPLSNQNRGEKEITITNNIGMESWFARWEDDVLGGDPEFFFQIGSQQSANLTVTKAPAIRVTPAQWVTNEEPDDQLKLEDFYSKLRSDKLKLTEELQNSTELHDFYISNGGKIPLNPDGDMLAIRLKEGYTQEDLIAEGQGLNLKSDFSKAEWMYVDKQKILLVRLNAQDTLSKSEAFEQCDKLKNLESVDFCNPVFNNGGELLIPTDEIIVQLDFNESSSAINLLNNEFSTSVLKNTFWSKNNYTIKLNSKSDKDIITIANQIYLQNSVLYSHPNFILVSDVSATIPNDTEYPYQWALPQIKCPEAWDITTGSPNIKVAVIDVGVDISHEDLNSNLIAGYDFVDNDNNPSPTGTHKSNAHGTSCAGIIASETNTNPPQGVAGVSWSSKIMPVRMGYIDTGGNLITSDEQLSNSIAWAFQNGADILSNSWGGGSASDQKHHSIAQAKFLGRNGLGCIILFSSGNENTGVSYPAKYPEVIAVGASDQFNFRCDYSNWGSNYGNELDLVAPGTDIYTTDIMGSPGYTTGNYTNVYPNYFGGTSAACPFAAGVAALVLSMNQNLTSDQVQAILQNSAEDQVGDPSEDTYGWDQYMGYGRINAYNGVNYTVNGSFGNKVDISVFNDGANNLNVTNIVSNKSWLTIDQTTFTVGPLGQKNLMATVNFDLITQTSATGTFTIYSSDPNNSQIQINITAYPIQNHPPTITSSPPLSTTVGVTYYYDVQAEDLDNDVLTYSLITYPTNMSINSSTGLISWNPNYNQTGNHQVEVQVSDGKPNGIATQSWTLSVLNPLPTITNISPLYKIVGSAGFTLTVNGTNYIPSSTVQFNGSNRATTYISSTQLNATILASDINSVGSYPITVYNPTPGGGTSNSVLFAIIPLSEPSNVSASDGTYTDRIAVSWSGVSGASYYRVYRNTTNNSGSATALGSWQIALSFNDYSAVVGQPYYYWVKAATGNSGENASAFSNYDTGYLSGIINPVPAITDISPVSRPLGSSEFTITVNGSNFVATSIVRFNGNDRATTFVNSTQLTATILASDLSIAGAYPITVFNPAPGGGASNSMTFTVNVIPTITITSPNNEDEFTITTITVSGTALDPALIINVGAKQTNSIKNISEKLNLDALDEIKLKDNDGIESLFMVQVRVNSGNWIDASGTSNWSVDVTLDIGENLIEAWAVDNFGVTSEIVSIIVYCFPDVSISGYIRLEDSTPVENVIIGFEHSTSCTTNTAGYYSMTLPYEYIGCTTLNYLPGWDFTPPSICYTDVVYNLTNEDYIAIPPPNSPPVLSWTSEAGYETDGVDPNEGTTNNNYTFKVKYSDVEGDAPLNGYPKLHIKKGGVEILNSPFPMTEVIVEGQEIRFTGKDLELKHTNSKVGNKSASNEEEKGGNEILPDDPILEGYLEGVIYEYSTNTLEAGTDYTYYFEASDINGNPANGEATIEKTGPIVTELFTDLNLPNLPGTSNGDAIWGDYDNDDDLDILLTGAGVMSIYRNDGNETFNLVNIPSFKLFQVCSADWGDYDNDGDLDIVVAGYSSQFGFRSLIYKNIGNDSFTEIDAGLYHLAYGAVRWGDYNNDGDLDIVLTGWRDGFGYTRLYKNDGNDLFTLVSNTNMISAAQSSCDWGDYDNDKDLDLLISGRISGSEILTYIHRNDGDGNFTKMDGIGLTGGLNGSIEWGDYNSDGDLDILFTGANTANLPQSRIYRNDGNNSFTDVTQPSLAQLLDSDTDWGDYDNDGDLDFIISGWDGNTEITRLYRNDGNDNFVSVTDASFIGLRYSTVEWGDFDNDGDLDLLLNGYNSSTAYSKVYRNNTTVINNIPAIPDNLSANVISSNEVELNWSKVSDDETLQDGLTYNLVVGSMSGGNEVISPMANRVNGNRRITKLGNANHNNSWNLKDLEPGTYYWSVQAIDNCFEGSPFAEEQSFTISGTNPPNYWTSQISGTSNNLQSVCFINDQVGWALGSDIPGITIIKTTNGGTTWNTTANLDYHFYNMYFLSDQIGWSCGESSGHGYVWKTTDGGQSWNGNINVPQSSLLKDVIFNNANVGWVVGTYNFTIPYLGKSTDGGTSWTRITLPNTSAWRLDKIFFLDESRGWAVGVRGYVIGTTDGGSNWSVLEDYNSSLPDWQGIHFFDAQKGFAVAGSGIWETTNGGISWTLSTSATSSLYDIQFIDNNTGWTVGENGVILSTTNGGVSWNAEQSGTTESLICVHFPVPYKGWAVGNSGTILRYYNSTASNLSVNLKLLLEGPYNGSGAMNTGLNQIDQMLIPLSSDNVYPTSVYEYTASTVPSIPNNTIVDWVLVELRTGTAAGTKIATQAAFLTSDGMIVDVDGSSPLLFTGLSAGNYYVVVRHRNHLAIMSASEVLLNESSVLYDFSDGQSQAYGIDAMRDLGDGNYGLYSGDASKDGQIDADDRAATWNERNLVGYKDEDVTMDGQVDADDRAATWNNRNVVSQVPVGTIILSTKKEIKDINKIKETKK